MPDRVRTDAFIATAPTTTRERRLAAGAVLASLLAFCVAAPYAQVQLAAIPAFIPLDQAALFINDFITAMLLLAQVPHLNARASQALVILACGYAFDALMIIPHTLTFPGLFSATGLLGAGEQTTAWIYMFWHAGFPLFVIAYAIVRKDDQEMLPASSWTAIIAGLVGVVLLVCFLTCMATLGQDLLPRIMVGSHYTPYQRIAILVTWLSSGLALATVYRRRRLSALDLWLSVVMCAWLFDVALSGVLNQARFDVGFYGGRIYGLVATSFVLTLLVTESSYLYAKLKRSQDQVAQSQKMEALGQLTGGIAHDFNNLLTIIESAVEIIELKSAPIERQELSRLLRPIRQATESGAALTGGLLAFARRQALAPKNIDINVLVSGMSDMLSRTLGRSIQVDTVLSASPSHCFVDPNQLQNAIINLAVNARDAMQGGGTLKLETEYLEIKEVESTSNEVPLGHYLVLSVHDTGVGMSKDAQAQAFEPFFTTKGADRGTGLGLSQVYGFVNQSGGHIRLTSQLGKGTTVKMFLPIAPSVQPVEEPIQVPAALGSSSLRVLLVEDNDAVRGILEEGLTEVGYDVLEARDANAALAAIRGNPEIDLLVVDLVLPDLNGHELADEARRENPSLQVVYMTGYPERELRANGIPIECTNPEILRKPFSIDLLVRRAAEILGEQRLGTPA